MTTSKTVCPKHEVAHPRDSICPYCEPQPAPTYADPGAKVPTGPMSPQDVINWAKIKWSATPAPPTGITCTGVVTSQTFTLYYLTCPCGTRFDATKPKLPGDPYYHAIHVSCPDCGRGTWI